MDGGGGGWGGGVAGVACCERGEGEGGVRFVGFGLGTVFLEGFWEGFGCVAVMELGEKKGSGV